MSCSYYTRVTGATDTYTRAQPGRPSLIHARNRGDRLLQVLHAAARGRGSGSTWPGHRVSRKKFGLGRIANFFVEIWADPDAIWVEDKLLEISNIYFAPPSPTRSPTAPATSSEMRRARRAHMGARTVAGAAHKQCLAGPDERCLAVMMRITRNQTHNPGGLPCALPVCPAPALCARRTCPVPAVAR